MVIINGGKVIAAGVSVPRDARLTEDQATELIAHAELLEVSFEELSAVVAQELGMDKEQQLTFLTFLEVKQALTLLVAAGKVTKHGDYYMGTANAQTH